MTAHHPDGVTELSAGGLPLFAVMAAVVADWRVVNSSDRKMKKDGSGRPPELSELKLHNGTVYRWNRPIYDPGKGHPHVRVENRVLPAGPTIIDTLANAAFYYGCVRTLANEDRPIWTRMSFPAAEANFETAARDGINARLYWPGLGELGADEIKDLAYALSRR